jgi:hypothetical protein
MRSAMWISKVGVAVLALVGATATEAIVTASGADPALPSGLDLSGVGALSNGCSSVLLAGGQWLLGAAHCAAGPGSTVSFANGATASITDLVLAPDWLPGQQVAVNDLSLMRLSAPPAGVRGFDIAVPAPLGSSVVAAGYGSGGDGLTGGVLASGTLHYGFNEYEVVLPDTATAIYGGHVVGFDFDDGSAAHSRFGSLGLGAGEAMLASFDSGGPSFVLEGGVWKIAGIHAGIAQGLGTTFGGVGFDLQPGFYTEWIQQVTAVPEPASGALTLAGWGAIGWAAWRRRRAQGVADSPVR